MSCFIKHKKTCRKLFGITTDSDLKFDKHNSDLCDKVSKKINVLCRVTGYMSSEKRRIVTFENVGRITFQLFLFNMNVTLQDFE